MRDLVKVHEGLRVGRRFDLLAQDLRVIADVLDAAPVRLLAELAAA